MITKEEYDRIQMLLGREEKPSPHTHIFAFTGMIRCKECGSMITAEEKFKRQKNGNVHHYIYYHCTKKKKRGCSQRCIRDNDLEKQIVDILSRIEIPLEFHQWAMKQLRMENEKEAEDGNKILANQQKAYDRCIKKLDALIDMRANEEISGEEFTKKRSELNREKIHLKELLNDTDGRVNKWIDRAEEVFDFTEKAREKFENGALDDKRQILQALGSNLFLKGKKLSIDLKEPLILVESAAKGVRAIHSRLEPLKNPKNKLKIEQEYARFPMLLRQLDAVRTCLMGC